MKKTIIIIAIIISVLCINKEPELPAETIRFRVIANSNSTEDQQLKKTIVKSLAKDVVNHNITTLEDEREYLKSKFPVIEDTIKQNTNKYTIKYGYNYFPEKEYKGNKYPAGEYESLVITLGEGQGDNFWCILFPPLCMIDEDDNVEYKSIIKEVINKYV